MSGSLPRDRVELAGVAALMGLVATMQISIAAAQILLAVAVLCWLAMHLSRAERLEAPTFFWPLVAYAATTLLAAGLSLDPAVSVPDCKQLFLFMLVPLVYDFARGERADTLLSIIISVGAASALVGIVQYGILNYDNLGRRMQGTLSHWMTYSGTLMLVICATVARLLFGSRDRLWAAFVLPALLVALALTLTRGAWIGAAGGAVVLLLAKDYRLTATLPVLALIALLVAPDALSSRVNSIGDMSDPTTRDRVAMLEAGTAMVKDHPWTGVGPDMVGHVYPAYRTATAVQANNPHLHNVPMQIAAERGLPALVCWTLFVISALVGLWRLRRHAVAGPLAAAAAGSIVAMLVAGLSEYNFGDSEFLMLLLVLLTLPFAAARTPAPSR
ncbi:MAG: O-antigen ligase family protein [Acidobacteria bacterium]|nr:O-antigen ligase family protein [Acidobacteriota bacterium]